MAEKRRERRFRKRLRVELVYGTPAEKRYRGFTRDVSMNGAFACASVLPPLGQRLRLVFLDGEVSRELDCEVVRHVLVPAELRAVARHGFGLRFLSGAMPQLVEEAAKADAAEPAFFHRRFAAAEQLQLAYDAELKHGGVVVTSNHALALHESIEVTLIFDWLRRSEQLKVSVVQCIPDGNRFKVMGVLSDPARGKALSKLL